MKLGVILWIFSGADKIWTKKKKLFIVEDFCAHGKFLGNMDLAAFFQKKVKIAIDFKGGIEMYIFPI